MSASNDQDEGRGQAPKRRRLEDAAAQESPPSLAPPLALPTAPALPPADLVAPGEGAQLGPPAAADAAPRPACGSVGLRQGATGGVGVLEGLTGPSEEAQEAVDRGTVHAGAVRGEPLDGRGQPRVGAAGAAPSVLAAEALAVALEGGTVPGGAGADAGAGGAAVGADKADAEAAAGRPHPRLARLPCVRAVLDGVVPPELCAELVFALKAIGGVGYRPHVRSATIHDIVATAPWLLPPLLRARAAVLAAVEEAFGLSLELCVEFSGLLGWEEGASLGWHHDANRDYLAHRHMSAVLYLNDPDSSPHPCGASQSAAPSGGFGGGDFRFQDGAGPLRVSPRAGRMVAYTADSRNVHCVEEVAWGERFAMNVWLSLEPAAAEDGKVLEQLQRVLHAMGARVPAAPLSEAPATPEAGGTLAEGTGARAQARFGLGQGLPETMYRLPAREGGGDLRYERLSRLGLYSMGWSEAVSLPAELYPWAHALEPLQLEGAGDPGAGSGSGGGGGGGGGGSGGSCRSGRGAWSDEWVWLGTFAELAETAQPAATTSARVDGLPSPSGAGDAQGQAGLPGPAASPRLLCFCSLQEAAVVSHFAAHRLGVAQLARMRHVAGVVGELRALAAARLGEVRAALPRCLALGSLLWTG